MEICKTSVRDSDILIVTEYKECIGKGVYDEIKAALDGSTPKLVYVMRQGPFGFYFVKVEDVKEVFTKDLKVYYGAVVTSKSISATKEAFDSANLLKQ